MGHRLSAENRERNVNRIIRKTKDTCRSRGLLIFALLAMLFLVFLWMLRSQFPGSAGEYQITEIPSQGNTLFLCSLNDNGQVVGLAQTSSNTTHTFLWIKEQGIVDLDTPGSGHSYPQGINNNGQVVGELSTSGGKRHAFVWQEETGMVDIHDRLKGTESVASGINSAGQIIGQYLTADNMSRAFAWDKSRGFRDLKIVSDGEWGCSPLAITDRGQGIAMMRQRRVKRFGFVVEKERELSFLLDHKLRRLYLHTALPFETNYCIAYDINNKGQIIVSARKSGSIRWYLMTPVDSARRSARKSE